MASKIDEYGLGTVVREMRENGKPIQTIAKILNATYIPKDVEKISDMAVRRWIHANHVVMLRSDKTDAQLVRQYLEENGMTPDETPLEPTGIDGAEDVNPYAEALSLVEDCDVQIAILKGKVERLNTSINKQESKYTIDINNILQRYIAQKQSLLSDIAKYQAQMTTYSNMKETIAILYKTLRDVSPEAYEKFKKLIAERQAVRMVIK